MHLTTYRLTVPNSAEALADCRFFVKDNQLVVKFYGNDVKWYENYEDVKALTALYEMFKGIGQVDESGGQTYQGAFVRIGEEDDDTVSEYFGDEGYDLEQLCRSVDSAYLFDQGVKLNELGVKS